MRCGKSIESKLLCVVFAVHWLAQCQGLRAHKQQCTYRISLPQLTSANVYLLQVLPHESDAAAAASCKQAVGNLLLCLLLQLTASWPPPPLAELAADVLSASPTASLLPSPASVLAPVPLVLPGRQAAAAAAPGAATVTAASSSAAEEPEQDSQSQSSSSNAVKIFFIAIF